jgi:hypothetical protein
MEYSEVLKHEMDNSDYWFTDPILAKQQAHNDFISPFSRVKDFCKKYDIPSPGVFNLITVAAVVRELKFLKLRGIITTEKMIALYKMTISSDGESNVLAEKLIKNFMEQTA